MQAVIGGCRSCPFPCPGSGKKAAAAEARRDPYLDAGRERHRDHLGSAGKGVGRARGQVAPKPVPTSGRQQLALPTTQQLPTYKSLPALTN